MLSLTLFHLPFNPLSHSLFAFMILASFPSTFTNRFHMCCMFRAGLCLLELSIPVFWGIGQSYMFVGASATWKRLTSATIGCRYSIWTCRCLNRVLRHYSNISTANIGHGNGHSYGRCLNCQTLAADLWTALPTNMYDYIFPYFWFS